MARFYADENFPYPLVEELRLLGHDVLTAREAGQADQAIPDNEVLTFAAAEQRALLTLNRRDFFREHQANPQHAGIIACTFDPDFVSQAERIHRDIGQTSQYNDQVIRINRPS